MNDSDFQRGRADLERELAGVVPGFEVVDRDLAVREALSIDWIGFDADGTLVIALWTDGRGAEVVLDVLDSLAFVRAHLDVLARHWRIGTLDRRSGAPRTGSALHPQERGQHDRRAVPIRAVCLAETFDVEALERLGELHGASLELFEVRTLRSQKGEGVYLVPARHPLADAGLPARVSFLEALPEELREQAQLFLTRMARVDEGVEAVESAHLVEWHYRGEGIGALRVRDGRLEASLPGFAASLSVRGEADVDEFVDQALGRLVDLTGGSLSPRATENDGPGARAPHAPSRHPGGGHGLGEPREDANRHRATPAEELPEIDEGEELAQVELIPMDSGALLTPEEIEAFRE